MILYRFFMATSNSLYARRLYLPLALLKSIPAKNRRAVFQNDKETANEKKHLFSEKIPLDP
jgi:hypothetical protein